MKNSEKILYAYLVESKEYSKKQFEALNEDAKVESIRVLAQDILKSILEITTDLNTAPIDQSRGDIKSFRWLTDIQNAINQLETIIERSKSFMQQDLAKEYISTTIKSIYLLNQYSQTFRDAYRNKKSLLILRYQSVLISIISSISYLFSALVDFSNNSVGLRENIRLEEISALRTLKQFNKSCETGEFKIIYNDVNRLREFYNEIPNEQMNSLLEAEDIFSTVISGVSNFYKNLDSRGKVTNLIYKAAGVIVALIAIREIFSAISRSKYTVQDLLNNIKNFTNLSTTSLPKLAMFSSKYRADAEENSKIAQRMVIANNKEIISNLKLVPDTLPVIDNNEDLNKPAEITPVKPDDFFF